MAPFRWPDTRHDIALAIEVSTSNPEKPQDWVAIAGRLSTSFSTDSVEVELKGRGCRERMERLLDKFKTEDAKAIKRCLNLFNYASMVNWLYSIILILFISIL